LQNASTIFYDVIKVMDGTGILGAGSPVLVSGFWLLDAGKAVASINPAGLKQKQNTRPLLNFNT